MAEALDVILRLFRGEIVTEKSDWYTFVNARAHLLPYTKPHPEVAVASAVTPSGGRLAGKYGFSMICVAATNPFGFDALDANWKIANDIAAEHGRRWTRPRLRWSGRHAYRRNPTGVAKVRYGCKDSSATSTTTSRASACRREPTPCRVGRRKQLRRHRHAGRRDRPDRAPVRQAGRVRGGAAADHQLGGLAGTKRSWSSTPTT